MTHLPPLIADLGIILMVAAIVTLIFRKLKQPIVLGYLIAGFLVGRHVSFVPTVSDIDSIKVWAEIGVIFLLFGLGLEFSFKKLVAVGRSATITAVFEVLFMLGAGYLAGQVFGWTKMDSLFLGGILSISSTTIIVRAFDELGLKSRRFVSLVFGVLIVEDLVAVLLLVLLSTVAATQTLAGGELLQASLKLAFFLILWFVVGLYLIPVFLRKVRDLMTTETMLVVSVGLCLTMVLLATKAGFSPALGAFVMGSILAETREGKTIEHLILPVKDLFAAVFFVSVGMLLDPEIIVTHFGTVVGITLITIGGKFLSTMIGALVSGQSLRHSVQSGLSLAQIGEFSFIIATLGVSLNVTSHFLYPIAVAVSAITTFTTPYQIKAADNFYAWLERHMPQAALSRLANYQNALKERSSQGVTFLLWDLYGLKILLNSVIIIAITLAAKEWLDPVLDGFIGNAHFANLGSCLVTLLICAPFFWPITFSAPSDQALRDVSDVSLYKALQLGVILSRLFIGLLLLGFVISQFFSLAAASGAVLLTLGSVLMFLVRYTEPFYRFFEKRFLLNLQEKDAEEVKNIDARPTLSPWEASLAEFTLSPNSDLVAKNLQDSKLKENFGVTVALIERGRKRILAPGREELLLPYDRVFIIGEEHQVDLARVAIEGPVHSTIPEYGDGVFGLDSLVVGHHSEFKNKPIRDSGLREKINGLIVGIERNDQRILSPDASMELLEGDVVWLVGDRGLIHHLKS